MKIFTKNKIKRANNYGKIEHKAGRIISIPILTTIIYSYYTKNITTTIIGLITLTIWIIYLRAHTLEKKNYGKGLRGTKWKKKKY